MSEDGFWVAAKNLKDNCLEVLKAGSMYVMSNSDKTYSKYVPLDVDDFAKGQHYGRVTGVNRMTLYYICGMDVSEEAIRSRISDKNHPQRIKKPARQSIGETCLMLSKLKEKTVPDVNLSKKAKAKKKNGQQELTIAQKFLKEAKKKWESLSDKTNFINENGETIVSDPEIDANEAGTETETGSLLPACTGNCALANFLKEENYVLKEKVMMLENIERKEPTRNRLLLSHDAEMGVPTEDGEEIPEGQVHMGGLIFIPKKEILKSVQNLTFDPRKRMKALLSLMYPENLHLQALDPNSVKLEGETITKISDLQVQAITSVMDHLVWRDYGGSESEDEGSNQGGKGQSKSSRKPGKKSTYSKGQEVDIRSWISKVVNEARTEFNLSKMSPTKKEQLIQNKKAAAKSKREERKRKADAAKLEAKKKKQEEDTVVNSSNEESDNA